MTTSAIFYSLTIALLAIAFITADVLGLHPITVTCITAAIVTAYLGWRTEDA